MQNTIIKEFANNPQVVVATFQEGGRLGETATWAKTFWSNYYLRDFSIWDPNGQAGAAYRMPSTGLPFGRGFIIDQTGRVALPYFGHQPELAIKAIYDLLGSKPDDPRPPRGGYGVKELLGQNVTYADGYKTRMDLRYPDPAVVTAPAGGWPGLVIVYGLGGNRGGLATAAKSYAKDGYLVITYDVRGQGEAIGLNPNAGGTLIGTVEKCDLAEILHRAEGVAGKDLDFNRLGVTGGSQGGLHAWAAAAWSGRPLPSPRGTITHFPKIKAVAPTAAVVDFAENANPFGCAFSNQTVEKFFFQFPSVKIDGALRLQFQGLFNQQDFTGFAKLMQERRLDATWIKSSIVPVLAQNSYDDGTFMTNVMLAGVNSLPSTTPHFTYLTTGHHGSPRNSLEGGQVLNFTSRWLHHFLKGWADDLPLQPRFRLAVTPDNATGYRAATTIWQTRQAPALDATGGVLTKTFYFAKNGRLSPTAPTSVERAERINHTVKAGFGPTGWVPVYNKPAAIFSNIPLSAAYYRSAPLSGDREVQGKVRVRVQVDSVAPNLQIGVVLFDEDPLGSKRYVTGGFHCVRGRNPGSGSYLVELNATDYIFRAGHRYGLAVENLVYHRPPGLAVIRTVPYFQGYSFSVEHSPGKLSRVDIPLLPAVGLGSRAKVLTIGCAMGRKVELRVDGSPFRAASPYITLASISGSVPGIPYFGLVIPLNYDSLTMLGIYAANSPLFANFVGTLDGQGRAAPAFNPGTGLLPREWVGLRFTFTTLVVATPGLLSSGPTAVEIGY